MGYSFTVGAGTTLVPDGQYKVIIDEIAKERVIGKRDSLVFKFRIAEGEHAGKPLRGFVNAHYEKFSPNTKFFRWFQAATGEELDEGCDMDTDSFLDRVLLAQVEAKESRKTKIKHSNVVEIVRCEIEL